MSTLVKIPLTTPGLFNLFTLTNDAPGANLTDTIGDLEPQGVYDTEDNLVATLSSVFGEGSDNSSRSPGIHIVEDGAMIANVVFNRETGLVQAYTNRDLSAYVLHVNVDRVNHNRRMHIQLDDSSIVQRAFNDVSGDPTLTQDQLVAKVSARIQQIISDRLGDPNFKVKAEASVVEDSAGNYSWTATVSVEVDAISIARVSEA